MTSVRRLLIAKIWSARALVILVLIWIMTKLSWMRIWVLRASETAFTCFVTWTSTINTSNWRRRRRANLLFWTLFLRRSFIRLLGFEVLELELSPNSNMCYEKAFRSSGTIIWHVRRVLSDIVSTRLVLAYFWSRVGRAAFWRSSRATELFLRTNVVDRSVWKPIEEPFTGRDYSLRDDLEVLITAKEKTLLPGKHPRHRE